MLKKAKEKCKIAKCQMMLKKQERAEEEERKQATGAKTNTR